MDNARFLAQLEATKRALQGLPTTAQREVVKVSAVMQREGNKAGGALSKGINQGLIRNSPLIVAGVAGALTAGAPAVLAGAGALFAGIGIAAAAQNEEVRRAFAGLRDMVKAEVATIAAPMESTLVGAADKAGAAFLRMEAPITRAVAATAPQLDRLVTASLQMAENALPGIVRAAEKAGPAVDGLGSFLESAGTGVSGFFSAVSEHGPEAGQVFDSLGQIVGDLLPVLGELLGRGTELASMVLPPLADGVGLVADAAEELGPLLPALVTGFAALKIGGAVAGGLNTLSGNLTKVAQQAAFASYNFDGFVGRTAGRVSDGASRMSTSVGKMSTTLRGLGGALPFIGIAFAGFADVAENAEQRVDSFSDILLKGGERADQLREKVAATDFGPLTDALTEAEAKTDAYVASLSPLERAQLAAEQAQTAYTAAVQEHGRQSPQAQAALDAYNRASGEAERQAGQTEMALHGVTQAMVEQANQALAAIDSQFGYQHALNQVEDAQADVNTAIKEHGANSEEAQRATLGLAEANYRAALAFGQQQADMSGAGKETAQYARIVQEQALAELYRLRDAAGPGMRGALQDQINMLEASGVSLTSSGAQASATAGRMRDLGLSVREVPGEKFVRVTAPTEDQKRRLEALGYSVKQIPGSKDVYVSANTADAQNRVDSFIRNNNGRSFTINGRVIYNTPGPNRNTTGAFAATGGALEGGRFHNFQVGGAVFGPGGGTDDLVPATGPDRNAQYRLSNGEHIWTAAEVRAAGGQQAVADLRKAVLASPRNYAGGGEVAPSGAVAVARESQPLFHADTVQIIRGDAQEVARILDLQARTR